MNFNLTETGVIRHYRQCLWYGAMKQKSGSFSRFQILLKSKFENPSQQLFHRGVSNGRKNEFET